MLRVSPVKDTRIVELAVKGTFLKQPYSVSYRLVSRDLYGSPGAAADARQHARQIVEPLSDNVDDLAFALHKLQPVSPDVAGITHN